MVFLSVIIPTFNEEKYIALTLESLKNQDYEGSYEIIVADGMSDDGTVKIAKKYADKIVLVERGGPAAGRNEGAKIAKGGILLFVDADTILLPNTLSELSKPFIDERVVGVACSVLPLSSKIKDFLLYRFLSEFVNISIKLKRAQIPGICCAYRRDAFEKVGGFDENLGSLEDFDLSRRIAKLGKIVYVGSTFVLTSHRRIETWGRLKSIRKYLKLYGKYLLAKNSLGKDEYPSVR
jgi:glycosyltransferase involved in cell wall biosynthesis